MTGEEVKLNQELLLRSAADALHAFGAMTAVAQLKLQEGALAPCIVLTAEEAEEMLDHRKHLCAACIRRLQKAPPSSPFSTETVLR